MMPISIEEEKHKPSITDVRNTKMVETTEKYRCQLFELKPLITLSLKLTKFSILLKNFDLKEQTKKFNLLNLNK